MEETLPKTLQLPPKEGNGAKLDVQLPKNLVLVGANGSGKTRMSLWIETNNKTATEVHRISAQKSLNMLAYSAPLEKEKAEQDFLYGIVPIIQIG